MPTVGDYQDRLYYLDCALKEFSQTQPLNGYSPEDTGAAYTDSIIYLFWTTVYHYTPAFTGFILSLIKDTYPHHSIIEVGCASGFSGLSLAGFNRPHLTFYDFEGVGLQFLRWLSERDGLGLKVAAYGEPVERHDWVLALDVMEHTGNHLGFLRWLESLGDNVALCYPLVTYQPPYVKVIDEWVDDEAIQGVIRERYQVRRSWVEDGRRYTVYGVK